MMKRNLLLGLACLTLAWGNVAQASPPKTLLRFSTMYAVDGPFVGDKFPIRGVPGDDLPWAIGRVEALLLSDGFIHISVRGLVFTDDEIVPPELRGINDEEEFRARVSCMTETDEDTVVEAHVDTEGFRANRQGNARIKTKVALPNPCVAPIVFILAADEDDWLAVTGVEVEED